MINKQPFLKLKKIIKEDESIDRQIMMEQKSSGSGMPGRGKGGGMMGKGGGMGRGNQSAMKNMLEPIKFWISLTLSTGNNPIDDVDAE